MSLHWTKSRSCPFHLVIHVYHPPYLNLPKPFFFHSPHTLLLGIFKLCLIISKFHLDVGDLTATEPGTLKQGHIPGWSLLKV